MYLQAALEKMVILFTFALTFKKFIGLWNLQCTEQMDEKVYDWISKLQWAFYRSENNTGSSVNLSFLPFLKVKAVFLL